ncbi:hypothetical protein [Lutibacter maritimus]|uniref:Uncharacterized protein n=1 Tax=Lutibacter maritimus TaxID=593133 RepID=A0A1I6NSG5_9FLAO|nr:hypothetical protein [Lutibacter maritimus]SFS30815.1 hypothetical protein SAMN04488006_0490 [Lutibacter maritimus]
MYTLQFKKNSSKYFNDALAFAYELNADFENDIITIRVPDEYLVNAYATFRSLFGIIQNWKGTVAYYNNKEVHPFQFILKAHNIGDCELKRTNCNSYDFGCKFLKLTWYKVGNFNGEKWVIDKPKIKAKLEHQINENAINICNIFDNNQVSYFIENLPDFIIPDNITFKTIYKDKYVDGIKISVPFSVSPIREYRNAIIL